MSETTTTQTAAAPAPESTPQAPMTPEQRNAVRKARMQGKGPGSAPGSGQQSAADEQPDAASDSASDSSGELGADDLEALGGDDAPTPRPPAGDTVRIGDHDVPIGLLEAAMNDPKLLARLKRKLKVDGQEIEVSLAEALETVPLARGAHARMREAAASRKVAEQAAALMLRDPVGAAERLADHFGISRSQARQMLDEAYLERARYEGLPEEERRRYDEDRHLRSRASRADELEAAEKTRATDARAVELEGQYITQAKGALEAAGVRVSRRAMKGISEMLQAAAAEGVVEIRGGVISEADWQWAAREVAKELAEERGDLLPADADGERLIESVGEAQARKIAQAYAARVRAKAAAPRREPGASPPKPAGRGPQSGQTWEEYLADADRRMGIRRG